MNRKKRKNKKYTNIYSVRKGEQGNSVKKATKKKKKIRLESQLNVFNFQVQQCQVS